MTLQSNAPHASGLEGRIIDAGRLKLVKILGEGAYGVVYLAVEQLESATGSSSKTSPGEFAVKVLKKVDSQTPLEQFQSREVITHKIASDHPGVLTLHDVLEDDWFIFLVLDYCPGGDLYNMIVDRQAFCHESALIKRVFVQILDAVQSCHDQGIYHRDLKPENIFVSKDCSEVRIGDFGLATDQVWSSDFGCGSCSYMSPECIGEEHNFSPYSIEISDIWSLGVIFVNIVTGRNPWRRATTHDEHFHRYMSDPDKFLRNLLPMSEPANELIKRVFTFNPISRISLEEFREDILAIDTFFPPTKEVDSAARDKRVFDTSLCSAESYSSHSVRPVTPQLPQGVVDDFRSMHAYPDEEYLFSSPDPDASYAPPSTSSTPSIILSPTSTLCDDDNDVSDFKFSEKILAEGPPSPNISFVKRSDNPAGAALRLLESLYSDNIEAYSVV